MDTEVVYLGHDNTIDLQLKASSSAYSLSGATKINITIGTKKIENSSASSGAITWAGSSYSTGEIRLTLGSQSISTGIYNAPVIVYDATHTSGIVWDYIPLKVKADPEGV